MSVQAVSGIGINMGKYVLPQVHPIPNGYIILIFPLNTEPNLRVSVAIGIQVARPKSSSVRDHSLNFSKIGHHFYGSQAAHFEKTQFGSGLKHLHTNTCHIYIYIYIHILYTYVILL